MEVEPHHHLPTPPPPSPMTLFDEAHTIIYQEKMKNTFLWGDNEAVTSACHHGNRIPELNARNDKLRCVNY